MRTNSYTELATAMHYWEDGEWRESKAEIEVLPDNAGAAARKGPHKVIFPADIYEGQIELNLPEGAWLRSRVLGLSYYDPTTGQNVLIAELTNSVGEIYGDNVVIYPNAFTDFEADLRYTYTPELFEQDVIFRGKPPTPEDFGLDSRTARLQVLTEFFNPPTPGKTTRAVETKSGTLGDETLQFGVMQIGAGKAFPNAPGAAESLSVGKQWLQIEGRDFLIEEVPAADILPLVQDLPTGASLGASGKIRRTASLKRELPSRRRMAQLTKPTMRLAQAAQRPGGFVMDYVTVNTSLTNYTFQGDTTYYISGNVSLYGTNTTFEGGAVLKYTNNTSLTVNTPVNWLAESYRPVVLTAKDDNTIGENILGTTGNPGTTLYAANALLFNSATANTNLTLRNLRVANAARAIAVNAGADHILHHVQLVNCGFGLALTNAEVKLRNALMYLVQTNFTGNSSTGRVEHLTSHQTSRINADLGSHLFITNSLLVLITNETTFTSVNNRTNSATSGVFTNVGAGFHYLVNNSTNRDAGMTNINVALLAELKRMTTYPPMVYSNVTIGTNLTLAIQAERDANLPDIGYHYDPLDWAVYGVSISNNVTLTMTNGVAVGVFGNHGFDFKDGSTWFSQGSPLQPNRIVVFHSVQEQPIHWGSGTISRKMFGFSIPTVDTQAYLRFNDISMMCDSSFRNQIAFGWSPGSFRLIDSRVQGGQFALVPPTPDEEYGTYLSNCTIERSAFSFYDGVQDGGQNYAQYVHVYHCLFFKGSISLSHGVQFDGGAWQFLYNTFDETTLSDTSELPIWNGYNAYVNTSPISESGGGDVILTNLMYLSGPLGNRYQLTNSLLINAGYASASTFGLYHYTTQTNQAKEGTSAIDIGYHYVALDSSGKPLDTDGDGTPDYVEDANGNGTVDSGEPHWQLAILTQPQSQTASAGETAIFTVVAGGTAPLRYQWKFNGTNTISGATNSSLTLSNLVSTNFGTYSVVVSNVAGTITSSNALLIQGCIISTNGLVAWWPAQSNTLDIVGGHNGTLQGGASYSNGITGTAFYFNGSNQRVDVPDATGLRLAHLTMEAWVNPASLPNGWRTILLKAKGPDEHSFALYARESGGEGNRPLVQINIGGNHYSARGNLALPINAWSHVAATYDGATLKLYTNGVVAASTSIAGTIAYTSEPLSFGGNTVWNDEYFTGRIDEPTLYNRALSATEIAALYHSGSVGRCPLPPAITKQPINRVKKVGDTTTFRVSVSGTPPLAYQWYYNGASVPAATSATYTITNLQFTHAGGYSVVITNAYGATTSSVAALTVSLCLSAVDVMLVTDISDSMDNPIIPGGGQKLAVAKAAATNFLAQLVSGTDQAGLISFWSAALTNQTLTNNLAIPTAAANGLTLGGGGGTRTDYGIVGAHAELMSARRNPSALPVMLVLSDGGNWPTNTTPLVSVAADAAKADEITLITIAFGTDADTNLMRSIASTTNHYYYATNANQLNAVYELIASDICRGTEPTNQLPDITWVTPATNQMFLFSPTNILLEATNTGGVMTDMLYYNGSTLLGGVTNAPYQFLWTNVTYGSYTLTAKGTNSLNGGSATATIDIIVNALPVITNNTPTNVQEFNFTGSTNIAITNTAWDLDGSVTNVKFFTWSNSVVVPIPGTVVSNNGKWSLTWNGLTNDTYPYFAVATDNRNTKGSSPIGVFKVNPTNTLPQVWITYPTNNEVFRAGADITITAFATNWPATVTNVEFFSNGQLLGSDSEAPYSLTIYKVKSGDYKLEAKVTDDFGWVNLSSHKNISVSAASPTGGGFWDPVMGNPGAWYGVEARAGWVKSLIVDKDNILYASGDIEAIHDFDNFSWSGGGAAMWNGVYWNEPFSYGFAGTAVHSFETNVFWGAISGRVFRWDGSELIELESLNNYGGAQQIRSFANIRSDLYVAGDFTGAGANSNINYFAKLIGINWASVGNGLNGNVHAIASIGNVIYIGGEFTAAGGDTNANYIARLNGTNWSAVGSGVNGVVRSLAVSGDLLFAGGEFTAAGELTNANRIAQWDGGAWSTLGNGVDAEGTYWDPAGIYAIVVRNHEVFVGGVFDIVNPGPEEIVANGVAKASWDESQHEWIWTDLDLGIYQFGASGAERVDALAIIEHDSTDGYDLFVGGYFTYVGGSGLISENIARWSVGRPQSTNAPQVHITEPVNNATFVDATSITNRATITQISNETYTVEFFIDGEWIGEDTESPYELIWEPPIKGEYTVVARAYYNELAYGPQAASSPVTFSVKNSSDTVTANKDFFTVFADDSSIVLDVITNDISSGTNELTITKVFRKTAGSAQSINGAITVSHDGKGIKYASGRYAYGTDILYYVVSDGAGNSDSTTVTVSIRSKPTTKITSPFDGDRITTNVSVAITNFSRDWDGVVTNVTLLVNGNMAGTLYTNASGLWTNQWTTNAIGFYTLETIATDNEGFTGISDPITIVLTNTIGSAVPTADIANLPTILNSASGIQSETLPTIGDGIFELLGTASGDDPVAYQVLLYRPEDWESATDDLIEWISFGMEPYADITPVGSQNYQGFVTNEVVDGSLGELNLTSVPNGVYDLVLRVRGGSEEDFAIARVQVDSNLKIGQFSFSEQDLALPVNGIPLTLTRTYNSLNPRSADFGYSWTYALHDMDVVIDEQRVNVTALDTLEDADLPPVNSMDFSMRVGGGRNVTLTLPDGRRTTFQFKYAKTTSAEVCPSCYDGEWVAPPGVNATLTTPNPATKLSTGDDTVIALYSPMQPYWQAGGPFTPLEAYDIPELILTTEDGTKYHITRGEEGEEPPTYIYQDFDLWFGDKPQNYYIKPRSGKYRLTRILQRSGDEIRINNNSVAHFAPGATESTRSMFMQRDAAGRITAIFDPNSGVTNDASALTAKALVKYVYNRDTGNLIQVQRLQDRAAGTYLTTKYHYDHPKFPHYITSIEDPRGIPLARNEYDDSGKLIAVVDADGKRTEFEHNTTGKFERVIDRLGNTNTFTYDLRGNVTAITNAAGQITTMAYDEFDNKTNEVVFLNGQPYATNKYVFINTNLLQASINALGHSNTFVYGPRGRLEISTDARGFSTTNYYDNDTDLLIATSDALGNVSSNYYNDLSLLVGTRDALGTVTTNHYDDLGNLTGTATKDAAGVILSTNTYAYDVNGNQTNSVTWRRVDGVWTGATNTTVYDAQNRVVQTIAPDGGTNTVVYNALGKQDHTVDALGRTNRFAYDAQGRVWQTTYADGTTSKSYFDAEGHRTNSVNQAERSTLYHYDTLGRITNTVYADNTSTRTYYDGLGRVQFSVDARNVTNAFGYDILGRRVAVTNAWGTSVAVTNFFGYDANGNQPYVTNALGVVTTNILDALNRVTQVQFADGTKVFTGFDAVGRRVAETNQDNIVTRYGYDGAGRLVAVTNAYGISGQQTVTRYEYDEASNQTAQIDALNRTNRFDYDNMGRRTKRTMPGNQSETFGYDVGGNLLAHTNFNGTTITNQYDVMSRLWKRWNNMTELEAYLYSATGCLTNRTDSSGTHTWVYDLRDRLRTNTTPVGSLYYTYDANGNQLSLSSATANGVDLTYEYDALNRLTNAVDNRLPGTKNTGYTLDRLGNLATLKYPNGVTNHWQYDSLNRLTNLTWKLNGNQRGDFTYKLGAAGHRTNLSDNVNSISRVFSWQFDKLYRLTNETVTGTAPTGNLGYGYDLVGNRTNRTGTLGSLGTQTLTCSANDWVDNDTNPGNGSSYFDANGNTTALDGTWQYDWANRLTNYNSGTATYQYDAAGNRIKKTAGGTTTWYLVATVNPSGWPQVVEEHTGASPGTLSRRYTYGLDLISQSRWTGSVWDTHFYLMDGLGSTRALLNSSGNISDTYVYDAYGTLLTSSGTTPNNYLFTGEQWDATISQYYLRARTFNPTYGRFWTQDTWEGNNQDPLSLHKYLYCHNDPCNFSDPSGLTETAGTQVGTGGVFGYLASSVSSAIGRASFTIYRTYGWVIQNPIKAELALFLGSQVAAPVAVEVLNEIADALEEVNKAADANTTQFSPGQFKRGFETEEMGGRALERRGGRYLGGNVRGIDGTLGFDKNQSLWQFKSHDLDEKNLLDRVNTTAEKLSSIDADDIKGTTRQPAPGQPGQPYFRAGGTASSAKVLVVFVPEGQARTVVSPQFISAIRRIADATKTIIVIRPVRGFKSTKP